MSAEVGPSFTAEVVLETSSALPSHVSVRLHPVLKFDIQQPQAVELQSPSKEQPAF